MLNLNNSIKVQELVAIHGEVVVEQLETLLVKEFGSDYEEVIGYEFELEVGEFVDQYMDYVASGVEDINMGTILKAGIKVKHDDGSYKTFGEIIGDLVSSWEDLDEAVKGEVSSALAYEYKWVANI